MINELAYENKDLTNEVKLLRRTLEDVVQRMNKMNSNSEDKETRWYAVVRGKWDEHTEEFESGISDSLVTYNDAILHTWMPIAKSFKTKEDAQNYLRENRAAAVAEGMQFVHGGVFSPRWFRFKNSKNSTYTIGPKAHCVQEGVDPNVYMERVLNASEGKKPVSDYGREYRFVELNDFGYDN